MLGVNNFRNIRAMRLVFFSKHWKFNSDSKNIKKMQQKIYGFLDNLA